MTPVPSAPPEVMRHTARVLVVDPDGRVLLHRTRWPHTVDLPARWLTIGGGIDPGETAHQGAIRELEEETGLVVDDLGEPVWHERRALPEGHDKALFADSTYFLLRTERFAISRDHWTADEHDDILDTGWFTGEELAATGDPVDPENVARILEMVLGSARPSPGDRLVRLHVKWDGTAHWRSPGVCLGTDEFGTWLGIGVGTTLGRTGVRPFPADRPSVTLIPDAAWSSPAFHAGHPRGLRSYTDVTSPYRWYRDGDAFVATAADLDLDVVVFDDRVFIDDEDEFAEHSVAFAYPPEVVAAARAEADRLYAAAVAGEEPYGEVGRRWLETWRADPRAWAPTD
jgi:8-oxo-dGTP pyrophosphatase MutT (NUDIX family)/protein associated with RNAse G/E